MISFQGSFGRAMLVAIVLALAAASCGSAGESTGDEAVSTTSVSTTTTQPVTTTTLAPTTSAPTMATPTDPALVAPLTGEAVSRDVDLDRPALVLKIDNHPIARPQTGLEEADIVFDLRAESVTRFTAVFHSRVPDPAGPVRSSRTSDFDLLSGLDRPLYGSSGGNDYVMTALRGVETILVTNETRLEYFRQGGRPAPHNLYVNASDLFALAPSDASAPAPWFRYRRADEALPPTAVASDQEITVAFREGPTVGFTWGESVSGWLRTQNGSPHLTATGDQLAPENVVIMVTTYGVSAADPISPELVSTGSGELLVLTDGHLIAGTWQRPTETDKPILLDEAGQEIGLTPGRTWVLYPEPGQLS